MKSLKNIWDKGQKCQTNQKIKMKIYRKIGVVEHSVLGRIDTFKSEDGLTLYRATDVTMMLEDPDYQKAVSAICKHPVKGMLYLSEGEMPATLISDLDVWRLVMNVGKETPEEYSDDEVFAIHCAATYGIALNERWLRRLTSDDEIERYTAAYKLIERMSKEKKV